MKINFRKIFKKNKEKTQFKLHIGCGTVILKEWINLDISFCKSIDLINDVRQGLPFKDLVFQYVFAEHFLEHLTRDEGKNFLKECFRILKEDGILRLSTPNLDWVWLSHYRIDAKEEEKRFYSEILIKVFYGWGHRFLYNDVVLTDALKEAAFKELRFFKYGESDDENL